MPHLPNGELVAKAWFLGVSSLPPNSVATKLPANQEAFPAGFVTVNLIPGTDPEMHVLKRRSMIDVNCWAPPSKPGGDRPQWNMAAALGEILIHAMYEDDILDLQRTLTMPTGYYPAKVEAMLPSDLERRGSDANSNACFGFDLEMHWVTLK